MILVSTIVAMGYVPIVLLIITHGSTSGSVAVSLWAVGISIVIIAIPLFFGALIRSFKESWANIIVGVSPKYLSYGHIALTIAVSTICLIISYELRTTSVRNQAFGNYSYIHLQPR